MGAAELRSLGQTRVAFYGGLSRSNFWSFQFCTDSGTGEILQIDSLIPARLAPDYIVGSLYASQWKNNELQPSCIGAFNIWRVCNPLIIHMSSWKPTWFTFNFACEFYAVPSEIHILSSVIMFNFNHHKIPQEFALENPQESLLDLLVLVFRSQNGSF